MSSPPTAAEILDREFLELRAKVLEVAAALDRLDRASGAVDGDPRMKALRQALVVLQTDRTDRAEQVLLTFSRPYEPDWRAKFGLPSR